MKNETITGYKVFNPDFTCRGFKYEVGKEYKHTGKIIPCESGFHFCREANDCFNYYQFDRKNIVCEVEATGKFIHHEDKTVTDVLIIKRQITWVELLSLVNTGKDNTGRSNSGDRNSGNSNSGNRNSGNRNSGHSNSGDSNSGDSNSGDSNSGHRNSGDSNSGNRNSGNRNSGHSNSGDSNSGNRNSGDSNSGHRNSGDSNSGNFNSTNYSSGVFNSQESKILMFNKPSNWTLRDWYDSDAYSILSNLVLNQWIWFDNMTDQEKIDHPKAFVCDGYLKTFEYKEACNNLWQTLDNSQKETVKTLPNFNPIVFESITGIKI